MSNENAGGGAESAAPASATGDAATDSAANAATDAATGATNDAESGAGPIDSEPRASGKLVEKLVGVAKTLGASDEELEDFAQEAARRSERECAELLERMQAEAKEKRIAEEKRAKRDRARTERETREAQKAELAKQGRVLCRAERTVLAEGMPQYEGDVFGLPEETAKKLAKRGDLTIL